VAGSWRIRHKLMLGMGLVAALMALLLLGALKGLKAYQLTMRTIDGKLAELQEAVDLREKIKSCDDLNPKDQPRYSAELDKRIEHAREAFNKYHSRLLETKQKSNDRELGEREFPLVDAMQKGFAACDAERKKIQNRISIGGPEIVFAPTRKELTALAQEAKDLVDVIYVDMSQRIHTSRHEYRAAATILVGASSLAVLLMAGLLRLLHAWVVAPLSALDQGVGRVARGDFEHEIQVKSGDEMQDLAEAFNTMTGRLRAMYTNLAQQVNERSRQLVRSERLAGVGFLAAGVAHEINNPLGAISFCGEALESRLADLMRDLPADAQERETVTKYLKMIQEEAFRCKEITKQLLAFSRGGEGKREETDLAEVLQGVLDVVQHLPCSKGKEVSFQSKTRLPAWVNQEVKQVFLNLVVNALESMDEGGRLSITHSSRDGQVELAFQDSGCGMTPDVLENIFEPFFTRSRTGKGTGLGLSISHRIITQNGGEIEAASAGPGQGSTFKVRLPIEPPADAADGGEDVLDPEEEFLKLSSARAGKRAA
jgi:signal transduction histidine kinase